MWGTTYTVVKWGHTEGIEREKTSSQKYTVIALDFWRDEFFLVFQIGGQNTIGGQFLGHYHLIWNCPWFLKKLWILFKFSNLRAEYNWRAVSRTLPSNLKLPLFSEEIFNLSKLRVLPAKSKCKMPSDFWWKRQVFFPLINIFFSLFLKDQKLFLKETKLFFSSEIWGHFAFTFCRYCLQNLFLDAI